MTQRARHTYDNGQYLGVYIMDDAEFAATGYTEGAEPQPVVTVKQVKTEAERRILEIMPEWKQRNTIADGLSQLVTVGPDPSTWPAAKQAELADGLTMWAQIEAIRLASDTIEAMSPIPADYQSDSYWP